MIAPMKTKKIYVAPVVNVSLLNEAGSLLAAQSEQKDGGIDNQGGSENGWTAKPNPAGWDLWGSDKSDDNSGWPEGKSLWDE